MPYDDVVDRYLEERSLFGRKKVSADKRKLLLLSHQIAENASQSIRMGAANVEVEGDQGLVDRKKKSVARFFLWVRNDVDMPALEIQMSEGMRQREVDKDWEEGGGESSVRAAMAELFGAAACPEYASVVLERLATKMNQKSAELQGKSIHYVYQKEYTDSSGKTRLVDHAWVEIREADGRARADDVIIDAWSEESPVLLREDHRVASLFQERMVALSAESYVTWEAFNNGTCRNFCDTSQFCRQKTLEWFKAEVLDKCKKSRINVPSFLNEEDWQDSLLENSELLEECVQILCPDAMDSRKFEQLVNMYADGFTQNGENSLKLGVDRVVGERDMRVDKLKRLSDARKAVEGSGVEPDVAVPKSSGCMSLLGKVLGCFGR